MEPKTAEEIRQDLDEVEKTLSKSDELREESKKALKEVQEKLERLKA